MANSIQKNQYWLRLVVCASEYINPGLLDILHNDGPNPDPAYKGIPRDPKKLYIFLSTKQSLKIINRLKNKNIVKQDQYELLFPPGCVETDSKKFDPTLNQVMIRNFTTLQTDNGRWKIDEIDTSDTSVAANAVRAVAFRNSVYHYGCPGDMKKTEFDNKFTEADDILKGMRGTRYTGNISTVKTMSLDPERISVLKALYNLVQIQTNKLQVAHDNSAADIASIKDLTTNVSKLKDDFLSYEKLSKQNNDSPEKMVDQLKDQVHKLMLHIESITITKVSKIEGEVEEIADRLRNVEEQHALTTSK